MLSRFPHWPQTNAKTVKRQNISAFFAFFSGYFEVLGSPRVSIWSLILFLAITSAQAPLRTHAAATSAPDKKPDVGEAGYIGPLGETPQQRVERLRWFTEGRFGMFIHWGVYSVPAGEWGDKKGCGEWLMENAKIPVSQYEQFARQFNPVRFDAREWVRIAKGAGMKYLVITSKHHDGFSMYRSDLTDWSLKATPFQRDPLKELADACQEADLKLGFYYSIMDWHHPDWPERRAWNDRATGVPDMDRYTAFMKGQLKELLTRYGPIGILWFDGDTEKPWSHERGVDLYYYLRSRSRTSSSTTASPRRVTSTRPIRAPATSARRNSVSPRAGRCLPWPGNLA